MTSLLPELLATLNRDLNEGQSLALRYLAEDGNVFITGGAGTGKSHLLRAYLRRLDALKFPVLASTGAAAVLVGGRTFHSFFGLGILEGGPHAAVDRALKDRRVVRRLKKAQGFVLDEVSMIPGLAFAVAERIASLVRDDPRPWGGLKVVAVGDFAQLPPVSRDSRQRDWAFLSKAWAATEFRSVHLTEMMRAKGDVDYCEFLADVRVGHASERVCNLLEWRSKNPGDEISEATALYAKKADVDAINRRRLDKLTGTPRTYETSYSGDERLRATLVAQAPVPEVLELKLGALVMIRQNDPRGRWVNGSLGFVREMNATSVDVELMNGQQAQIEATRFSILDAEGNERAAARNLPLNLAYAVTIHKAQGATIDRAIVSLKQLWEPGQAYVALSRVRSSEHLTVDGWDAKSIFADPQVAAFHRSLIADTAET